MTLDDIRQHGQASPFVPFTLRLSSGRDLPVVHHEFLSVPPIGELIVVWDRKGHPHVVDVGAVEAIDHSPRKAANGGRRRK